MVKKTCARKGEMMVEVKKMNEKQKRKKKSLDYPESQIEDDGYCVVF